MKVCLAASGGGHLSELLRLRKSWLRYEEFYITTTNVVEEMVGEYGRVYIVKECNRQHPVRVIIALLQCIRIVLKERPDVVISTGAAPACMVCILAKLLGARIIWIDSLANVETLSLSGRIIAPFADILLTQWPDVALKYKKVEFLGEVI